MTVTGVLMTCMVWLPKMPSLLAGILTCCGSAAQIPILKGAKLNKAVGPFNPTAELLNGRAAM